MGKESITKASPLSTGGAGTIVEYRLAGVMLTKLLLGDSAPGIAMVVRVRLQGAAAGHPLDDIIAFSGGANLPRVEMQVKRTMRPVPSDDDFVDALEQCLRAIKDHGDAIDSGELQLCLAATGPVPQLNALKELTDIARMHTDYSSLQTMLVPPTTAKAICDRFVHAKQTLANITKAQGQKLSDEKLNILTHRFLMATRIWCIDVGQDGRDTQDTINRLADIVPQGIRAADVFTHLIAIVQEQETRAGTLDNGRLRALLLQRGVSLSADPKSREKLAALQASGNRFLQDIRHTIGASFHLPRTLAVKTIIEAIAKEKLTLLSGSPGVGKTVLMREALLEIAKTGTVIGLSLAGRTNQSLAHIQAELGAELATTLPAAATTGQRVLFIDGAEQILTDGGRLLAAVLGTVPNGEGAPEWYVVATSRSDAAPMVAQHLRPANPPKPLNIDELSDDEVAVVVKEFPVLSPLQRHPRSARLLRRPYLVDLLIRANVPTHAEHSLGEEDILIIFWQHLVRLSEGANPGRGAADIRAQICLDLAEATITTTNPTKACVVDGESLPGLRSDDILTRDRMYHRFAHDILLDYACAYRLLETDADALLDKVVAPRRFLRAVRLAAQWRLADVSDQPAKITGIWKALHAVVRAALGRWDTGAVVDGVAVAAPGALDGGVCGLGAGVGSTGDEE